MLAKPETCIGCPLYEKGLGFVPDKIQKRPRYLFIGEAPGKNEVAQGEPFVGKAGFVLKEWGVKTVPLLQLAHERGEISYGNTLRCLPPEIAGRAYPKGEEKRLAEAHCRRYDAFSESLQTVVLFGESPQRCWFKPELEAEDAADRGLGHDVKGVTGRIGRVYERAGTQWVFAPHPAFVLRQPALVGHLQEALKIASGAEKLAEPKYYEKWSEACKSLEVILSGPEER